MKLKEKSYAGLTIPEVMVATLILVVFFASVFELNAVCLRYINASKENVAALQSVQDRAEVLRNLAFSDLVDQAKLQTLLITPPNGSDFGSAKATEVVKLSAYPTANGVTQLTRMPNGAVTINSTATDLGNTLVQVEITTSWTMTLGGRPRSEQITTIVSNGTKK